MNTKDDLFNYFDEIVDTGSDDQLFASSYLRDFINLAALELDQDERLTEALFELVHKNVKAAKAELSPQDQSLVNQFLLTLQPHFS